MFRESNQVDKMKCKTCGAESGDYVRCYPCRQIKKAQMCYGWKNKHKNKKHAKTNGM